MCPDRAPLPWSKWFAYLATDAAARALIRASLVLPYTWRVCFMGWLMKTIIGPVAGYAKRARRHITLALPEIPETEVRRIAAASLDNAGRTLIENYSASELRNRQEQIGLSGPGQDALRAAVRDKKPVILVSGHFGNYEATRMALAVQGITVGGLYRDMKNPFFNKHYIRTLKDFGEPMFAKGRQGTTGFVRHLKSGGRLVLLSDQHVHGAPLFDFLGHPARTSTSAADMAIRHHAVLIPFYGIRMPDGLSFDCVLETPIPHSDPKTMTQQLNDSLAARILTHPEQWFWVARRWRSER